MINELVLLVTKQLNSIFLELSADEKEIVQKAIRLSYEDIETHIESIAIKGYGSINLYHSGQYATILYRLSRKVIEISDNVSVADRLYYLNKVMNSIDLYHGVTMPELFYFEHPVGTVIGKAHIGERLAIYQGCTIGGVHRDEMTAVYPIIDEDVIMFSNASVIGECHIGSGSIIASNTVIKNQNVPSNSLVFGTSPNLVFKPNNKNISFFKG